MRQSLIKYILLFLFSNVCSVIYAQENADKLSSITLGIGDPEVSDNVTETNKAALVSKIESLVTESGVGSSDYNNNFIIHPKFIVNEIQKSSGGMRAVSVADCSFILTVMQQNSGGVFLSIF